MFSAGTMVPIQALTQASTGTTVTNYGVTTFTSAGSGTAATHGFTMQNPIKGVEKALLVDPNSTREVKVIASTSVQRIEDVAGVAAHLTCLMTRERVAARGETALSA